MPPQGRRRLYRTSMLVMAGARQRRCCPNCARDQAFVSTTIHKFHQFTLLVGSVSCGVAGAKLGADVGTRRWTERSSASRPGRCARVSCLFHGCVPFAWLKGNITYNGVGRSCWLCGCYLSVSSGYATRGTGWCVIHCGGPPPRACPGSCGDAAWGRHRPCVLFWLGTRFARCRQLCEDFAWRTIGSHSSFGVACVGGESFLRRRWFSGVK